MDISITGLSNTDNLRSDITFEIDQTGISDRDNITLLRFSESEWGELETDYKETIISNGRYYDRFVAETPGFSLFAIVSKIKIPEFFRYFNIYIKRQWPS